MEKEIILTEAEEQAISCLVSMICQYISKSEGFSWTLLETRIKIGAIYGKPSNRSKMDTLKMLDIAIVKSGYRRPRCSYSLIKNPPGQICPQIDGIRYSSMFGTEKGVNT